MEEQLGKARVFIGDATIDVTVVGHDDGHFRVKRPDGVYMERGSDHEREAITQVLRQNHSDREALRQGLRGILADDLKLL